MTVTRHDVTTKIDEVITKRARLPKRSIMKPRKGEMMAETRKGREKREEASCLFMPNWVYSIPAVFHEYGKIEQ